jgi:putative exporter of polyketide antibiotics
LWILSLPLILISFVASLGEVFPTAAARQQYADNAGFVALYGPCPAPASASSSHGGQGSSP